MLALSGEGRADAPVGGAVRAWIIHPSPNSKFAQHEGAAENGIGREGGGLVAVIENW
jgi:hypothetical protein